MPNQTHYCTIHGSEKVDDCPECNPEVAGDEPVEEAHGFRVAASPNVPDPQARYRSAAGVTIGPGAPADEATTEESA